MGVPVTVPVPVSYSVPVPYQVPQQVPYTANVPVSVPVNVPVAVTVTVAVNVPVPYTVTVSFPVPVPVPYAVYNEVKVRGDAVVNEQTVGSATIGVAAVAGQGGVIGVGGVGGIYGTTFEAGALAGADTWNSGAMYTDSWSTGGDSWVAPEIQNQWVSQEFPAIPGADAMFG